MEKNKELIIKYLASILTEKEKIEFEEKIKNDINFKNELDKINNSIEIKNNILNEKYFVNLLPVVRNKIQQEKKHFDKKIVFGLPSLVLSLILIFLIVKNYNIINDGNSNNLHETINDSQVVSQYFYEIDDDVKAKYFDVIITQPLPIETKNNFEKEQIISFYDSIIDDTSLDYNLSEDELNKLIADLKINIK